MATLDRYIIAYRGLSIGRHSFSFDMDNAFFEQFSDGELQGGSGKADIELERHENFLVLDVDINADVRVVCDRCLDDFSVSTQYNSRLIVKFSDEVEDELEDASIEEDILWLNPSKDFIDLKTYIYDSIVLSLPVQRIHSNDENGKPLCDEDMLSRFAFSTSDDDEQWDDENDED